MRLAFALALFAAVLVACEGEASLSGTYDIETAREQGTNGEWSDISLAGYFTVRELGGRAEVIRCSTNCGPTRTFTLDDGAGTVIFASANLVHVSGGTRCNLQAGHVEISITYDELVGDISYQQC